MSGIPRRIIQTGKSAKLPLKCQVSAAGMRALNPNFEYLFFDDQQVDAFMAQQDGRYKQAFRNFKYPIQRFDFFRYLAVYKLGGFYFDLDVYLSRTLEDLVSYQCVFSFEELTLNRYLWDTLGLSFEIGNYAFGSAAGHPFLKDIIENCVRSQTEPEWLSPMMKSIPRLFYSDYCILNSTGPGLLSRTLGESTENAREVRVLMPSNPKDLKTWHNFGSFGVHMMDHTWRRSPNPIRKRLFAMWKKRRLKSLIASIETQGKLSRNNFMILNDPS